VSVSYAQLFTLSFHAIQERALVCSEFVSMRATTSHRIMAEEEAPNGALRILNINIGPAHACGRVPFPVDFPLETEGYKCPPLHHPHTHTGIMGHVDSGKTSLARALSTTISTAGLDKHPQSQVSPNA